MRPAGLSRPYGAMYFPAMRALPLLPLVLLAGCSSPDAPSPAAAPTPVAAPDPSAPSAPPGTAVKMRGHFEDSVAIRDAVIAGELSDVRPPAARLADAAGMDALPPAWQSYVRTNSQFAAEAVAAKDIAGAAQAAAGLARTCGECHAAIGSGPTFVPGEPPRSDPADAKSQMARHQWAADRMWQGLVSRNDGAWRAGATALTDAPLCIDAITADVELPDHVKALGDQIHGLGTRALATPEWPGRAQIYGEFITACASCHRAGC